METIFRNLSKQELSKIKKLYRPHKIQEFIDSLGYNTGKRLSVLRVLRERKADCLEAAVFASAVLQYHKIENFLISLESVRDEDHVLCIYKIKKRYGSLAQSKFLGLKGRSPVYSSVRELVMSYFEHYFNFFGELTLKKYSEPFFLDKLNKDWVSNDKVMYIIEKELCNMPHIRIIEDNPDLPRVGKERFAREILVRPKNIRIGRQYQCLEK
ncbi:hypothetical protein JXC34_00230 [Candidatus Woesearchaeota archaeon]|nr:hypothetical protein [Candidatus Woesearchaeota archaeon]